MSRSGSLALMAALLCASYAQAHAPITTTVQFDREIVRILDNHCVACHHPSGPAFALLTYEQTYGARWQIRQDALSRHMAPWAAVAGYGDFLNDNALTQREIDFVSSWAESFGPRNNGAVSIGIAAQLSVAKSVQAHADFSIWAQGKPDQLLTLSANVVAAEHESVQHVILDPQLKSERWLNGLEYKPGDRRVVHAAVFSIQETGQWLASWTPWHGYMDLPQGLAYRLPAGTHIAADIHYYGTAAPVTDAGSLALYFSEQPPARVMTQLVLRAQRDAPAGPATRALATTELMTDANILALDPALCAGVQSIEVRARTPEGTTQVLLFARDIPVQWPTPYLLRNAVRLARGTQLSVIEHYAADASIPAEGVPLTVSFYSGEPLPLATPDAAPASPAAGPAAPQRFRLQGTVKSVDVANGRLVIAHGDIPGYMGAMTMSYAVRKGESLQKIATGDQIHSDVVVSDSGDYLENIEVRRGK